MKLMAVCVQCWKITGQPNLGASEVEFSNDGELVGICPEAHRNVIGVQNYDCEILFDIGGMALLDGFTREAVTAFAAALERAYELYLRVVFETLRPPTIHADGGMTFAPRESRALFDGVWKQLRNQSERQLGAFVALYAFHEGEPPPLLSSDFVGFRNECTHKGVIPSRARAMEFGEAALRVIERIREVTRTKYAVPLKGIHFQHLSKRFGNAKGDSKTTMEVPTIIRWSYGDDYATCLADRLKILERYRHTFWRA